MYLYIMKYDVHPDKTESFTKWAKESAIPRILKIPGLVEFSAWRPVAGSHQIGVLYKFKDMASCAAWLEHSDNRKMMEEFRPYCMSLSTELWGPSPNVPEPLHPKK